MLQCYWLAAKYHKLRPCRHDVKSCIYIFYCVPTNMVLIPLKPVPKDHGYCHRLFCNFHGTCRLQHFLLYLVLWNTLYKLYSQADLMFKLSVS